MPRFSANLTMLFNEVDFLSRFEKAARAGFKGVEFLFPYQWDKGLLAELLEKHRLEQVLHNLPAGSGSYPHRPFRRWTGKAAHFQLADNPGRHEPGTGEINYPYLFNVLIRRDIKAGLAVSIFLPVLPKRTLPGLSLILKKEETDGETNQD
jgi:hydroxypyruvate isomerase